MTDKYRTEVPFEKKYTLSALMPNYNCAKYIPQSIEAVLNQTYPPDELIICDDASTDNSVEIIQAYAERYKIIKFIRNETNMGVHNTVNKMFHIASGDYVYPAGADNYILPNFFEKSMQLLTKYPNAGLSASFHYTLNEKGHTLGVEYTTGMGKKYGFIPPKEMLSIITQIGCGMLSGDTFVFKKEYILKYGGYPEDLQYYNDTLLGFMLIAQYGVCFINEPLVCVRLRKESLSAAYQLNTQRLNEALKEKVTLMRTTYSDIFSRDTVDKYEKNMYYNIYFQDIYFYRRSILHKFKFLNKLRIGRIFYSAINIFLYIRYAFTIIIYLSSNKYSIITFLKNYIDNVIYKFKYCNSTADSVVVKTPL